MKANRVTMTSREWKKRKNFFFNRLLILIFLFRSFTVHFMQIDTQYWTTIAKELLWFFLCGGREQKLPKSMMIVWVVFLLLCFRGKEKLFLSPLNRTKPSEGDGNCEIIIIEIFFYSRCHNSQDDDNKRKANENMWKYFLLPLVSLEVRSWGILNPSLFYAYPHHCKCHFCLPIFLTHGESSQWGRWCGEK